MIRLSLKGVMLGCSMACLTSLAGCTRDWKSQPVSMWNESRYKPMEASPLFEDGSSARPLVPGTVARGQLRASDAMYSGRSGGKLVSVSPVRITTQVLQRGQERFNIYCAPCHGAVGDGQGMIVKRGFTKPPDYAIQRLRTAPIGHFYDVITNGYGAMYSYASRVQPNDRWAIAAYIRVLQRSRPVVAEDRRIRPNLGDEEFIPEVAKSKSTGTSRGQ